MVRNRGEEAWVEPVTQFLHGGDGSREQREAPPKVGTLRSQVMASEYENEGACIYPLIHARAVTLSPPAHTKLSCIASRTMTTKQDLEYNQMFLNA